MYVLRAFSSLKYVILFDTQFEEDNSDYTRPWSVDFLNFKQYLI